MQSKLIVDTKLIYFRNDSGRNDLKILYSLFFVCSPDLALI